MGCRHPRLRPPLLHDQHVYPPVGFALSGPFARDDFEILVTKAVEQDRRLIVEHALDIPVDVPDKVPDLFLGSSAESVGEKGA